MIGGFRVIQHNEVRDVFAQLFRDAGHTVEVEPLLQKLSGEVFEYKSANKEDDARSDIKVTGFWREMRQAFFDVKVVSPFARSNSNLSQEALFKKSEKARWWSRNSGRSWLSSRISTNCGWMASSTAELRTALVHSWHSQ